MLTTLLERINRRYIKQKNRFLLFINTRFNKVVSYQIRNPHTIPIIIINFNQLKYLKLQITFLLNRGHSNIVVIDNLSTFKPLLDYYETIIDKVTILRMDQNYGHMVLFDNPEIYNKYCKGYYIVSDADIIPNAALPKDYILQMIRVLLKQRTSVLKVGFALDIKNIPKHYMLRDKVIRWEQKYWDNEIGDSLYMAGIDTTFALYTPNYPQAGYEINFYAAIRMGGNYTATHGGWQVDFNNLSDEERFYMLSASKASSWKTDASGNLQNNEYKDVYE